MNSYALSKFLEDTRIDRRSAEHAAIVEADIPGTVSRAHVFPGATPWPHFLVAGSPISLEALQLFNTHGRGVH
jgi:hypothetical protein